jgi:hypothetical protein
VTTVFWGSDAVENGWSALYPAVDLPGEEVRAPMVAYRANAADDSFMVTLGIHVTTIQEMLYNATHEHTWLAIVAGDGTVLGATGTAQPFDRHNKIIILKTTDQVADPVWRHFGGLDQRFAPIGEAPGTSWTLYGNAQSLPVPGAVGWTLWMATSHKPVLGGEEAGAAIAFACEVVLFAIFGFLYIASARVANQHRTKAPAARQDPGHLRKSGVGQGIFLARQFTNTCPHNREVLATLDDVVHALSSPDRDYLYDATDLYESISDDNVRARFRALFGDPADSQRSTEEAIDRALVSRPVPPFDEGMGDRITTIVAGYNHASPLFARDAFEAIVRDLTAKITKASFMRLLYDSMEWDDVFLKGGIADCDPALAVMVVTIAWHCAMLENRDSERLSDRFVLADCDGLRRLMLKVKRGLFQCLVGGEERWRRFVRTVNDLVDHAPLSRASDCLASPCVAIERRVFIGCVFVSGLISFMFRPDGFASTKVGIAGGFPKAELAAFCKCLTRTIVKDAWEALAFCIA